MPVDQGALKVVLNVVLADEQILRVFSPVLAGVPDDIGYLARDFLNGEIGGAASDLVR